MTARPTQVALPVLFPGPAARGSPPVAGSGLWRSLDELAGDAALEEWIEREFPALASADLGSVSRRRFLQLMAASFALAGLNGCGRPPPEKIVPRARAEASAVPGRPLQFATALLRGGHARGVVVTSHDGRPTKIEGNPDHPGSLGRTDAITQADILTLYDPERSKVPRRAGREASWNAYDREFRQQLNALSSAGGRGLHILTGTVTSPTSESQMRALLQRYPEAKWYVHEPIDDAPVREGAEIAFGRPVEWAYQLDKARRILALESNFLFDLPGSVRYARDFAAGRRVRARADGPAAMNRLYALESSPTITGAQADHRVVAAPDEIEDFAFALAAELGAVDFPTSGSVPSAQLQRVLAAVAEDLRTSQGDAVVIAGRSLSPAAHAVVCGINAKLGAVGGSALPVAPLAMHPGRPAKSLAELCAAMAAGDVQVLVILECNPAHTAPAELGFARALHGIPFTAHWGLYVDETARRCLWHVPAAHDLESWGDARGHDGTVALIQPLIAPLYGGRCLAAMLAAMLGGLVDDGRGPVEAYWKARAGAADFRGWWRAVLQRGVVPGTAAEAVDVQFEPARVRAARPSRQSVAADSPGAGAFCLTLQPDARVWDGRYANNAWLQETPDPISKIAWDNALWIAPAAAERLGIRAGDVVRLQTAGGALEAAAWPLPGQHERTLSLSLGGGRSSAGRVGNGFGFDAYRLRTPKHRWIIPGVRVTPAGGQYPLATTQNHHVMEGRDLLRHGTLAEFRRDPQRIAHPHGQEHELPSLYPGWAQPGAQWGMVIDLSTCIGCNACTVACQAENNIPVVGKQGVQRGREMHWIRIDRYFEGRPADPRILHQPLPCMHCENAPCEYVCPTGATQHSHDGLNEMIYNRCIGTRYCSNNCPYKVRRFNFLAYAREDPTLELQRNPEVSVRVRGVMEKCTYCVQRIRTAEADRRRQGLDANAVEVVTACQQVCPTDAIIFGNIKDGRAEVSSLRSEPHHYALLHELNTRPRTTYLAAIRNPNPLLEGG